VKAFTNIAILGPGLIWGKGLARSDKPSQIPGAGNKAIALKNCYNVVLRDVSILKGGWFGILATGVDNLTIDNLKLDTDRDGMDIDCCRNVRVSNCSVNSPYDDGICPKSLLRPGLYPRHGERHDHQLLCYGRVPGRRDAGWHLEALAGGHQRRGGKRQRRRGVRFELREHLRQSAGVEESLDPGDDGRRRRQVPVEEPQDRRPLYLRGQRTGRIVREHVAHQPTRPGW